MFRFSRPLFLRSPSLVMARSPSLSSLPWLPLLIVKILKLHSLNLIFFFNFRLGSLFEGPDREVPQRLKNKTTSISWWLLKTPLGIVLLITSLCRFGFVKRNTFIGNDCTLFY